MRHGERPKQREHVDFEVEPTIERDPTLEGQHEAHAGAMHRFNPDPRTRDACLDREGIERQRFGRATQQRSDSHDSRLAGQDDVLELDAKPPLKALQHADAALDSLAAIVADPDNKDRLKACTAILSHKGR